MKTTLLAALLLSTALFATDAEDRALYDVLTSSATPQIQADAIRRHFTAAKLKDGSAVAAYGGDFVWAIENDKQTALVIDDKAAPAMRSLPGNLWVLTQQLSTGRSHAFFYDGDTSANGDPRRFDKAAFTADSYPQRGVAKGKLSEQMLCTSQVYGGHKISYWIYASPGVDPAVPAPLMVFHDGQGFANPNGTSHLMTVVENLVAQKKIPPMVLVFVAPGYLGDVDLAKFQTNAEWNRMRSIQYDTVNDDYNKMLTTELLPEVEKRYKLRSDGYSRGAAGQSSGGILAFNMAWQRPQTFSRVLTRIGSFTSIQWRRGQPNVDRHFGSEQPALIMDGGNVFPFLVRQTPRKNIRVWMDDGANDLENDWGSWPLQNIELANSLKMKEYDFYFSFGNHQHSTEHGNAELPRALAWLWRDYDPLKTSQDFTIDPAEKAKPLFRVGTMNR